MPSGNETRHPALLLLSGLPGAGKTTFVAAFAERLPLTVVESDAVRRELFPEPQYSFAESGRVFAEVGRRALLALAGRRVVVVDATNLADAHRRRFLALARRLVVPVIAVRITAPDATVRARLGAPRIGFSQAGLHVFEEMRPTAERFAIPSIVVDTRYPLEPALRAVAALLEESR